MKRLLVLMLLSSVAMADPCDISNVLAQIRPGEQWKLTNNDPSTLIWFSQTTPPSLSEINAGVANCPAQINVKQRSDAVNDLLTGTDDRNKLTRAILLLLLDRINVLQQREDDRSADVAATTSLADLKARWAARSALGQITVQQAQTAVQNKINSGASD